MASDADIESIGSVSGFVGPQQLNARVIIDRRLQGGSGLAAGANRIDMHVTGLDIERDLGAVEFADLRETRAGDRCDRCGGAMALSRGIEVGQLFALGTRYTEPMEVLFQDRDGKRSVAIMGCYGIGVSRLMAAVVEQAHDDAGIAWPPALAPFHVGLISMGKSETVAETAERIYDQLIAAGIEVLWDDRNERPGVKFKDFELIGLPLQVVVGDRGVRDGVAEFGPRGGKREAVALDELVARVVATVAGGANN